MAKQSNTESIAIVRKHTWQVPLRISMYDIEDGRKFVLLEGGKREAAVLTRTYRTRVNLGSSGASTNGLTANPFLCWRSPLANWVSANSPDDAERDIRYQVEK